MLLYLLKQIFEINRGLCGNFDTFSSVTIH